MKNLTLGADARQGLASGIKKMAGAVKSTLGPCGNTVILESPEHIGGMTITKDGVTVARSIALSDPVENMAVRIMRQAADRTATMAGDGTTTAVVIAEAMTLGGIEEGLTLSEAKLLTGMADKVAKRIDKLSKKVKLSSLEAIATISANNDAEIGAIIATAYKNVGADGIVTVQRSQGQTTYVETTTGMRFQRGYTNRMFVNDQRKDECILEDAYVLVSDTPINNILSIENVLKPVINSGKPLVIIADCSDAVQMTLAANVVKNGLKFCVVQPPSFGWRRQEQMGDIAFMLGGKYFSEQTGDDLSIAQVTDLGIAKRIVVGREETIIVRPDLDTAKLDERVKELWEQHKNTERKDEREFIMERIASLRGGMSVIYVGANTDVEQKELYDRVDDAVCAVRSALAEGVLPGGGVALNYIAHEVMEEEGHIERVRRVFCRALMAPFRQILENAGIDDLEVQHNIRGCAFGFGLDLKSMHYGDMMSMGVIDPAKVTKNALISATSVAATLLGTNAIITNESNK